MKYIDEKNIFRLLDKGKDPPDGAVDEAIDKSLALKRLSLEETSYLLNSRSKRDVRRILEAASLVKSRIYGSRVVIFAPLYINNTCVNNCLYCAFRKDNILINRRRLDMEDIAKETVSLLKSGHKRVLAVSSESGNEGLAEARYYVEAIRTMYGQEYKNSRIRRININCAPLPEEGFKLLKSSGIGTYQLFQETYHGDTYKKVHPSGPKSDPDNRLDAIDRAFRAGIDDVGIGALFGLYDHKFEVLALLSHVEHLERTFGVGPHTISVPRIEPALGTDINETSPYKVSDDDFKKLVAVLRLAVPYTGIILSTRETPEMRDELFRLGISQVSAASRTSPGGYSGEKAGSEGAQFFLSDHRSLDEVIASLIERGAIPSFCTACYRKERTGETFMGLARPGTIKGKCALNALITLKEYLKDFASEEVKEKGNALIERLKEELSDQEKKQLDEFFIHIERGVRDEHV
ncbi:MAG: [FeFe] hydrogenase H-cluster radical SAM maturase HydG [Candidatus Omnitrophota bacterium]